jgi:hypothetical protein
MQSTKRASGPPAFPAATRDNPDLGPGTRRPAHTFLNNAGRRRGFDGRHHSLERPAGPPHVYGTARDLGFKAVRRAAIVRADPAARNPA